MLNQPAEQITKDVNWIIENAKGGPVSINVVGVPKDTPNENIYAMRDAVEAYNKKKEEEDED
jgi:uroporphyrinogen-III decarboxylase